MPSLRLIRNLQGGRFINNKEKYYFPSSAATEEPAAEEGK